MALDASGISDIWKDDEVEGNQLAENKILRDNNLNFIFSLHLLQTNIQKYF